MTIYILVLTKPLHLGKFNTKPRTVSMTRRKLKSIIIQVGYLGSSEPDLRSGSAKTTLGSGLL